MAKRICIVGLAIVGWCILWGTSFAQDSKGTGHAESIRTQLSQGSFQTTVDELGKLPTAERLRWLSEFRQSKSYRESNSQSNGASGGGAIANYDDLIRLIETSIDADWATNGGTATMTPFRQGVRITTEGLMERVDDNERASMRLRQMQRPKVSLEQLGDWQQPADLRWVSLHQLDRMIADRIQNNGVASISMELLAGLVRIDYIALDPETNEWLIGGPAGDLVRNADGVLINRTNKLPPVLLEDLLSIAPHVLQGKGEFGCSIDPIKERLISAYEMASRKDVQRSLQRDPQNWVEQWRKELGPQRANVVGLAQDSPTGFALLLADAHMKRLGMGLETPPAPLKSYWAETDVLKQRISNGLVRWWFTLSDAKIPMDPDRRIYKLEKSNVRVLSEAQWINERGERVVATSPDIAADAYARGFTQNFGVLQESFPEYGRLRHIFDLAVVFEIVRTEIEHGNGKPFEALNDPFVQPHLSKAPREIESIAATHRAKDGTTFAVVSGGVAIEPSVVRKHLYRERTRLQSVVVRSGHLDEMERVFDTPSPNDSRKDEVFWR